MDEDALDESLFTAFEGIELFCDILQNVASCYLVEKRTGMANFCVSRRIKACLGESTIVCTITELMHCIVVTA